MNASVPRLFKAAFVLFLLGLFTTGFLGTGLSQVSGNTFVRVQPSETEVHIGGTFSISVVIESVENLYALEVTLRWNASVLQFQSVDLRLGVESHPDGVLHEDSGAEIYIANNNASDAEYHLAATAVSPASSFNGSGAVFNVSFKVLSVGLSSLDLETELADRPPPDGTANLIEHTAIGGSVVSEENASDEQGTGWLVLILVVVLVAVAVAGLLFLFRKRPDKDPE